MGHEMDKTKAGLLNKSLAVSLSINENWVGNKEVYKIIDIICDADFDENLISKQVPALEYCKDIGITAEIVRNRRERDGILSQKESVFNYFLNNNTLSYFYTFIN